MYVFTFLEKFFHKHVFLALLAKKEGRRNLKMIVFDRKDSPPPPPQKNFKIIIAQEEKRKKNANFWPIS